MKAFFLSALLCVSYIFACAQGPVNYATTGGSDTSGAKTYIRVTNSTNGRGYRIFRKAGGTSYNAAPGYYAFLWNTGNDSTFLSGGPNGNTYGMAAMFFNGQSAWNNAFSGSPFHMASNNYGATSSLANYNPFFKLINNQFAVKSIYSLFNSSTNGGDLVLTPSRVSLSLTNTSGQSKAITMDNSQFTVADGINNKGMVYSADYSATGVLDPLWIPNWGAVKQLVSTGVGGSGGSGGSSSGTSTDTLRFINGITMQNDSTGNLNSKLYGLGGYVNNLNLDIGGTSFGLTDSTNYGNNISFGNHKITLNTAGDTYHDYVYYYMGGYYGGNSSLKLNPYNAGLSVTNYDLTNADFSVTNGGIRLVDNINYRGLVGDAYYGANYTPNTYVQKEYVDSLLTGGISPLTFNFYNGLTGGPGEAKLGGTLTENTNIEANGFPFSIYNTAGDAQNEWVSTPDITTISNSLASFGSAKMTVAVGAFAGQVFDALGGEQERFEMNYFQSPTIVDNFGHQGLLYADRYISTNPNWVVPKWYVDSLKSTGTVTDSTSVHLAGAETISGFKTFNAGFSSLTDITVNGLTIGRGRSNVNTNTILGYNALTADTTSAGYGNTALGSFTLTANTTGAHNTAVGSTSLYYNTTGAYNNALGVDALYANTSGGENNAFGSNTLAANTSGGGNNAFGHDALYTNTTGSFNTSFGLTSMQYNTTGSYNVSLGAFNMRTSNTTGSHNIALGAYVEIPSGSSSGQLNIGNVLYGSGLYQGTSASSAPTAAGMIGIGTTTPLALFSVGSTSQFQVNLGGIASAPQINLSGSASGTVSLTAQAAAGTYNFNLPVTPGTAGQVLTSAGGGSSAMTWTTPGGAFATDSTAVHKAGAETITGLKTFNAGFNLTGGNAGLLTTVPTNTLTLGSTATGIASYNTTDQTTNYERVVQQWNSNYFDIGMYVGGTGSSRSMRFGIQSAVGGTNLGAGRTFTVNNNASAASGIFDYSLTTGGTGSMVTYNTNISGTNAVQNMIAIQGAVRQTGTSSYNALLITPYEGTVGTGTKYLINAGTNSGTYNGGTHTPVFTVTDVGNAFLSSSLSVGPGTGARISIAKAGNSAAGVIGAAFDSGNSVIDNDATNSGTVALTNTNSFRVHSLTAASAVTYTNAATVYIDGAPTASTNVTLSNSFSLYVKAGFSAFNGGIQTGSAGASNFLAAGGASIGSNNLSGLLFGGASTVQYRALFNGTTTQAITSGTSYSNVIFGSTTVTTAASGTHAVLANLVVNPLGAVSAGGASVTNTASLYINGNSSTTVTGANYGLWATGNTRVDLGSDATGDIIYRASSGSLARLPVGSTGQVLTVSGGVPVWGSAAAPVSGTPSIAAGSGAGTSPTVSVTSNGHSLQVTLTVGTSPSASATVASVTLANALSYTPYPTFSPANSSAASLASGTMIFMTSTGSSNVTITSGTSALPAGTYVWNIQL